MEQLKTFRTKWQSWVLVGLLFSNFLVWMMVFERRPDDILSVYFFDVGQGDAVLIESPTRGRVLIDGGYNRQILSELGEVLPFGDRRLDVVIGTHPDADHTGAFPEVFKHYDVGAYIWPGVLTEKSFDLQLWTIIEEQNVPNLVARRGMVIDFGDGAKLSILFPDQDVARWDANDASIVARLIYGNQTFLFTGDSPLRVENILISLGEDILNSDVLKVGHHGSRTSTSLSYATVIQPIYAIISASKNNSYNHPHLEVVDNLEKVGANTLSTAESGTIIFKSDGQVLRIK